MSVKIMDLFTNTLWSNTYASGNWKGWQAYIKNADLNGTGSATISHRTKAGGGWLSAQPSIVLEGTKGVDEVVVLSTITALSGKWYIAVAQKDNTLRFRYIGDSGNVAQFSLDPDRKTTSWSS